jgi:zinc protease
MRNFQRILTSGLLLCCAISAAAKVLSFEHWQTSNGATVYFNPVHALPIVDIKIGFYAGSAHDDQHTGLASVTNRLLFEATNKLNADNIANQFENLGASYSNDIDRDYAYVSLRTLAEPSKLDPAVNLFTDVISQARFPAEAFSRKQAQSVAGLEHNKDSPNAIADNDFYATLFAGTPYALPVDGTVASVNALTAAQCEAFYQSHYSAGNAVIAMVGDIDSNKAHAMAENISHAFKSGEHMALPNFNIPAARKLTRLIEHPSVQSTVRIGQVAIARQDPDYMTLKVGNHPLGGGIMTSRLTSEVRIKRGLTYGVYSGFAPMKNKGPFLIGLQTLGPQTQDAITITQQTLNRYVQKGPTDQELKAAKDYLTGSFALYFGSNDDIASQLLALGLEGLPDDYFDTYIARIEGVKATDITAAFAKTLKPDQLLTVIVGRGSDSPLLEKVAQTELHEK